MPPTTFYGNQNQPLNPDVCCKHQFLSTPAWQPGNLKAVKGGRWVSLPSNLNMIPQVAKRKSSTKKPYKKIYHRIPFMFIIPPKKKNNKNELTCFFNYCFLGFVETTFVMVSVCNSQWISVHAYEHVIFWKRFRWWYFSPHIPRFFVNWIDEGVLSPGIRQWFCEHLFFLRHCLPRSLRNDSCAVP